MRRSRITPAILSHTFCMMILVLLLPFARARSQTPAPAAPGSFLDVDGSKIYYEECGKGPEAVVLIHDGIAHSVVWDPVWPSFCQQYHTIRYDRRGYGRTPAAKQWYYETDDLQALLRHLQVKHAMLVGSSHGGELAIDFTLQHPDLVEQLVLVGAVVSGYGFSDQFIDRGIKNYVPYEKKDVAGLVANWANDKYLLAEDHTDAKKVLLQILTASPQDLTHDDMARPTRPAVGRLGEIRVPTLILVGDQDIPDVHAHAGVIENGIPNSRRFVVEDAGHLMYLEKSYEFSHLVIAFLQANHN
ncbi:MAG: alpha/beta hydrolase [Candidatus Acidiferrales bacterium]